MSGWWHARRATVVLVFGLSFTLLPWRFANMEWSAPTPIGGGKALIDVGTFLLLAWGAAITYGLGTRGRGPEAQPVRRVALWDCAGLSTSALLVALLGAATTDSSVTRSVGLALLTAGLAGLAATLAGARLGAAVVTLAFAVTFAYAPWLPYAEYVRFLQPQADPLACCIAGAVVFALAIAALLRWDHAPFTPVGVEE